eukprot:scaffold10034_cov53-Attheya_sp.AAC.10
MMTKPAAVTVHDNSSIITMLALNRLPRKILLILSCFLWATLKPTTAVMMNHEGFSAKTTSCFVTLPTAKRYSHSLLEGRHQKNHALMDVSLRASTSSEARGEGDSNDGNLQSSTRRDIFQVVSHVMKCSVAAMAVCAYEDYDCSTLKPLSGTIRPSVGATRGMGRGSVDRSKDLYEYNYGTVIPGDVSLREVPSYNEVMEQHRTRTVPQWQRDSEHSLEKNGPAIASITRDQVQESVADIFSAVEALHQLQDMANDYQWDEMKTLLRSPVLTSDLENACSCLRGAVDFLDDDARRDIIGFNWGSCAWRHCGAEADAQETLAELYNSLVERSLRDIVAVIPKPLLPRGRPLPSYKPYEPQGGEQNEYEYGADMDDAAIESDFLKALSGLRNGFNNE